MESKVSSEFMPYAERGMIRDPRFFYNREAELNTIFNRLATMQSVSVVGERRLGKSSLLYRISEFERDRLGSDYTTLYLDMERVFSSEEFYKRVCVALGNPQGTSYLDFEEALANKKVILCLDEFERTTNSSAFDQKFFAVLRSLAQTGQLALVVATQHTLAGLHDGIPTSPFQNIFTLLTLGPFSDQAARELITAPSQQAGHPFSEQEIEFALEQAGTHPYRLNLICSLIYDAKRHGTVSFPDIKRQYEAQVTYGQPAQSPQTPSPNRESAEQPDVSGQTNNTTQVITHEAERPTIMYTVSMLVVFGLAIGWFSIQESSSLGIFRAC
ncbi:MAG: hypothetical protein ETSY1_40075, partial [Candidatus Entotheonella factor]